MAVIATGIYSEVEVPLYIVSVYIHLAYRARNLVVFEHNDPM